MGFALNMLLILTVINIGLIFFGFNSGATTLFEFLSFDATTGELHAGQELSTELLTMLGINLGAGILAGGILYFMGQGQYAMFAGIVVWLLSFAIIPTSLFTNPDMPLMARTIIGGGLFIGYVLSLVAFFRGVDL